MVALENDERLARLVVISKRIALVLERPCGVERPLFFSVLDLLSLTFGPDLKERVQGIMEFKTNTNSWHMRDTCSLASIFFYV